MRRIAIIGSIAASLALAPAAGAASTFVIRGGGYGHGIGMSQYGAYGYALHGEDYRFILAHYFEGTSLATTDPNQIVRVLLSTGRASFTGATAAATKKLNAGLTYTVGAQADGTLVLRGRNGKQIGRFQPPLRVTGPAPLELVGQGTYRGALEFSVAGGAVQAVNALGLEDYVRGVVASEMPSSWSAEALKAQAVAARTYALTSNVGGVGFQLYPDTRSQAYGGVGAETPSTDAAVAATRGQIVTYNGAPVTTYFSSSSGGYTENVENVWLGWSPELWLQGVPDPYDGAGDNPYHRWSYRLTMAGAARDLGSLVKGKLVGILVTKRGVSPRVVSAQVVGTRGRTTITGPQLRSVFDLPSTYMMFASIATAPGPPPSPSTGGQAPRRAFFNAVEASIAALFAAHRELHGSVFPAPKRGTVAIQLGTQRGWRTVGRARLGSGGTFLARVGRAGTYRILYQAVPGPSVTVR